VLGVCRRLLDRAEDVEDAFQATFLMLVRKAGSIRRGDSVASWLYKVAYRVALRARADRPSASRADLDTVTAPDDDEVLWRDLRPVLDEEVRALPEKYRTAFVLCALEGRTNQEAADALGCPLGTVLSRLSWARQRLRDRLSRRGVAVTAVVLMATLARQAAAAVPPELTASALKASLEYAGTAVVSGAVSAKAALLAEGVLKSMLVTKLKWTAAVVGTVCLLTLGGWSLSQGASDPKPPAKDPPPAEKVAPPTAPEQDRDWVEVPARRDGALLFVGAEVTDPKAVAPNKLITVHTHFLATEATRAEAEARKEPIYQVKGDDRSWRRWKPVNDPIEPNKMKVFPETRYFRKLAKNDPVQKGQLLGLIDPSLAVAEVDIKIRKFNATEADLNATTATRKEAHRRYLTILDQNTRAPGSISAEEVNGAKLTWERYVEEEKSKSQAVGVARGELNAAHTVLSLHEVRSPVKGVVTSVFKKSGEAAKALEPVLRIRIDNDDPER
jgi:RNA polymerase sigma factor (sigma-70 family)